MVQKPHTNDARSGTTIRNRWQRITWGPIPVPAEVLAQEAGG